MSILFPILSLYTLIYLGLMIYDFVAKEAFKMPDGMMVIYIALVGAYAADKEIRRWMGKGLESRSGAYFVYAWLLFFLVAFLIYSFKRSFTLPEDLIKVVLQVLAVFFGSKASKKIYEKKTGSKVKEGLKREEIILEAIKANGRITRKEVAEKLKVSSSTAGRILEAMEQKGRIQQAGEGKGTYYTVPEKAQS